VDREVIADIADIPVKQAPQVLQDPQVRVALELLEQQGLPEPPDPTLQQVQRAPPDLPAQVFQSLQPPSWTAVMGSRQRVSFPNKVSPATRVT